MIKLVNYSPYGSKEAFISKAMIHSMERMDDMTRITMDGGHGYTVKETPEEILAMPDIEESNKSIDWEQRRYEIAKEILSAFVVSFGDDFKHRIRVKLALEQADALIEFLKEK